MAKDFANGQKRKGALQRESRGRPRRHQSAFHMGSFGAGIVLGIAFTLAGALLPGMWSGSTTQVPTPRADSVDPVPVTRFEFFERLPSEMVSKGTSNAGDVAPIAPPNEPREFLLQAGSFTNSVDADRLRATLLSTGLNTETATVTLSSGAIRHRVIVGPFASALETQRAMSALRDQDIEPLVLARKLTAG